MNKNNDKPILFDISKIIFKYSILTFILYYIIDRLPKFCLFHKFCLNNNQSLPFLLNNFIFQAGNRLHHHWNRDHRNTPKPQKKTITISKNDLWHKFYLRIWNQFFFCFFSFQIQLINHYPRFFYIYLKKPNRWMCWKIEMKKKIIYKIQKNKFLKWQLYKC